MTGAVIAASILLALLPFAFRAWGNRRYRQGLFDGQMSAQHKQLDERWTDFGQRVAGRHRTAQPRKTPGDAMVPGEIPGQAPREPMKQRHLVTTAHPDAPVILPQDGAQVPMRPRPAESPDRPTAALPPLPASTGEMRALTDERIMRMREDTEAWLAETRLT